MLHRKAAAAAALLIASLTACGGEHSASSPHVSGKFGVQPHVSFGDGVPDARYHESVVTSGSGRRIGAHDFVKFHITSQVWGKGKPVSTYQGAKAPNVLHLGSAQSPPVLAKGLYGKRVGSRLLVTEQAGKAFGSQLPPGMKKSDVLAFVIDVVGATSVDENVISRGKSAAPPADIPGLRQPKATVPEVEIPKNAATPKVLRSFAVVHGSGEAVKVGQTVIAQSRGWSLNSGKEFQNTYKSSDPGLYPLGSGMLIKGWELGLADKHVGDRVEVVIPADLAYGDKPPPNSAMGKNASLVFVVDILGVV
ncbi:FKBP-type peptidyl-prolyl cis-trans isomerase [Streptomyces sp. NPDC048514]|uniref:FKBP-type peptidyl-prolyl cis-trans isomerase n=1 Tax=Streptomyces sp. NPDC048514 TaxID=3365564 RepID=UPI00371537A9